MALAWDGTIEVLEIQDVRSRSVFSFGRGENAFQEEWVRDAD